MATKAENRKTVIAIAAELGITFNIPKVSKLNADAWEDMVSDIKAKQRDARRETVVDTAVEIEPEVESVETAVEDKGVEVAYCVKPGGSITSLKGVLTAGDPIKPEWLSGDTPQESFDNLVDKGYVVEVK